MNSLANVTDIHLKQALRDEEAIERYLLRFGYAVDVGSLAGAAIPRRAMIPVLMASGCVQSVPPPELWA